MSFTQQTFLGASIRYFRGSLGWGENPSTLNVGLVEDPANGDSFFVPSVGVPVMFDYSGWRFGGLIQNWTKDFSPDGHPVYEVILVDPREILSGVQLILSGYSDTTYGVPNLINVYGYHENNSGFGGAEVNDAGIPWQKVRDAVVSLTTFGTSSSYGGSISLGGYVYQLNLSGLPQLPSYFRVPAQSMTLMDYIKFVCDAANYDYFFVMNTTGLGGIISLVSINRNIEPLSGAIDRFISLTGGSVTKNAGYELRNEITSKFLIGGPLSEMYIQANTDEAGGDDEDFNTNPEQNSIWPYWGLDYEQNAIIGNNTGNYHQFNIPTKGLNVYGVDDYYPCDVAELRAAYEGFDAWAAFLCLYDKNRYISEDFAYFIRSDEENAEQDYEIDYYRNPQTGELYTNPNGDNIPYRHLGMDNPHFGKATKFQVAAMIPKNLVERIAGLSTGEIQALNVHDFMPHLDPKNLSTFAAVRIPGVPEDERENLETLYNFVSGYARSYYGQQFMVRMPFIESAEEAETNNILVSRVPVTSGFIDEDTWDTAVNNNYLPGNVDRMLDSDFKIKAYVRFNDISTLDFSGIEESNIILSDDGNSAFILCDVSSQVVYEDFETKFSPRAIVTLPGAVFPMQGPYTGNQCGVIAEWMLGEMTKPERNGGGLTREQAKEKVVKLLSSIGSTNLNFGIAPLFVVPDIFVIPLQSNIARYGPWYATGANGKLDLEIDENLVPWAFGGYDEMNQAADAKVSSAISRYQVHEAGSVQYPGVPAVTMGSALISGGPYVTDIDVSIGPDGAKTTYNMGTWTPQPFRFRKAQSEYITRVNKKQQELRQQFRTFVRAADKNVNIVANRAANFIRNMQKSARKKKASPHLNINGMIQAVEIPTTGDNTRTEYRHVVAIDTDYGFAGSLASDYERTGGGTLDTLFVPFSTNPNASGIPKFSITSDGPMYSGAPDGSSLNPFVRGSNFAAMIRHSGVPEEGMGLTAASDYRDIRGIALRSPLILAGWGYDIDEYPVPNSGTYYENDGSGTRRMVFHQDFLTRKDLWKVGPVDIRWDEDKDCWVAGGAGTSIKIIKPRVSNSGQQDALRGARVFEADEYIPQFSGGLGTAVTMTQVAGGPILVGNFRDNIVENVYYMATKIGNNYFIDNQSVFIESM